MQKQLLVGALAMAVLLMNCPELLAAGRSDNNTTYMKGKGKKNGARAKKTFNAQKKIDKFLSKHATELNLTSDQQAKIKALSNLTTKKELKHAIKKILTKAQKQQLKADHKAHKANKAGGKKHNKKNK